MEKDDYRFSLSADKYLEKHQVVVYMEDAISQFLEHKDDNPKVIPTKFFSDYFTSVKEGNHTLFREYSFVRKTRHNRASFVHTFWKCFRNIGRKGDLLSIREYHSLLCLLCSDFPFAPVQKTARIILMDDAMDCLISFSDFLYAFQVQFCFEEFLTSCGCVYRELQDTRPSAQDPVVVPTSEEGPPPPLPPQGSTAKPDGVDSMQFFRALLPICEKLDLFAPPVDVMKEIMNGAERVTFYGFLMALAKSDTLTASIGKLPIKAELLDVSELELASSNSARQSKASNKSTKSKNTVKKCMSTPGVHDTDICRINGQQAEAEAGIQVEKAPPAVAVAAIHHSARPVSAGLATNPQPTHHHSPTATPRNNFMALRRRLARSEARQCLSSTSESDSDDSDN